ncbi:MAG TPA: tail fiber domain-containing protein [Candidatus Elarobacter sp.]|nr:tail fiber domain-containing protein [Candidatus Elarobacter sp.]
MRKTASLPTCSGTGTNAVVGDPTDIAASSSSAALSGYENDVCDPSAVIAGGDYNTISSGNGSAGGSFIGSGGSNTITGASTDTVIGGGSTNAISGTANYSVIVGGENNTMTGGSSVITGGYKNTIAAPYAFLGSGSSNQIAASASQSVLVGGDGNTLNAQYGALVGGLDNVVSGEGAYIAAGGYNTASGEGAVVDGGFNQTASGAFATVPGGYANDAVGTYSFAAGARASAQQTGTFVWSDGSDGDAYLTSARAYQFLARASGGFTLYTNAGSTVGAQLSAGSGTWASLSDRRAKTNIVPLDDAAVLDKVAALPISRWSYRTEHGVRHVGPMAQDFYAAFRVGEDDRHITSIDEDGVALAAIKALNAEVTRQRAEIRRLTARLDALR